MALGGWEYFNLPAQVDESPLDNEAGVAYVQRLASNKAYSAASHMNIEGVIIAADTTVVDRQLDGGDFILGKPRNDHDAREMLLGLRGHAHQVYTALAILTSQDGKLVTDLCTTLVPMRDYTDQEIDAYVASGDPLDKAGAYAIQHTGFHPVDSLEGCFANVMGLPLCHLARSLSRFGIIPPVDLPLTCQKALSYHCTAFPQILSEAIQDYTCR